MATNVSSVISGCSAGAADDEGDRGQDQHGHQAEPGEGGGRDAPPADRDRGHGGLLVPGADGRVAFHPGTPAHPAAPAPLTSSASWWPVNRPPGRTVSTARNSRLTASTAYAWFSSPTTTWVMPSATPPARVPHSEPMPPITTASNAKISVSVPVSGSNVPIVPMNTPARAAVAIAMPA